MIERILPSAVVSADTTADLCDGPLFPEEEALIGRAVGKRRREFESGRACARRALGRLGVPPVAVTAGPRGEPLWPEGVVGSITHCAGYRAAAAGSLRSVGGIGIDAEPNTPLPDGVLTSVASPGERDQVGLLAGLEPGVRWDRLLFSAKEAVYKVWYPLTGRPLDFEDAEIAFGRNGVFSARLLVTGGPVTGFTGRWHAAGGLLLTAIVMRPLPAGRAGAS
uniref:PyrG4 n=1 Tax=Streptomyces rugosporus TaxID=295838 RepID=K7QVW5_STRRG|nr:PyrG4 [Streptomyces rugosporus]